MEEITEKQIAYKEWCELCRGQLKEGICMNPLCKMATSPYNEQKQVIGKYTFFDR